MKTGWTPYEFLYCLRNLDQNIIDNSLGTTKINLGIKPTGKLREGFSFTKTNNYKSIAKKPTTTTTTTGTRTLFNLSLKPLMINVIDNSLGTTKINLLIKPTGKLGERISLTKIKTRNYVAIILF